ncbi:MAG: N-formylglutamate deformylase [Burkholderiaceae bacterium]|nr:N-formylglutamate deformylase [Burkholderiaceae bacterium]
MHDNPTYTLHRGDSPLLVSLPHIGTDIPAALRPRYTEQALAVDDTDWHLHTLYAFAAQRGASLLAPRYSRYVIDLNRPPENAPMYPGVNNTELCPTHAFSGQPLYRPGQTPGDAEVQQRLAQYWQPYHAALAAELQRLHTQHGYALLWDGHSIQSTLPWLFDGTLPDLNLGTASGSSCAAPLRTALAAVLSAQTAFSQVVDGRFKGGYITRHYGRPEQGVHAVQMEMCFSTYMQETPPFQIDPVRARRVQPLLEQLIDVMLTWRPHVHTV